MRTEMMGLAHDHADFVFSTFLISYDKPIFVNLYDRIVWEIRLPVRSRQNIGFYTYTFNLILKSDMHKSES